MMRRPRACRLGPGISQKGQVLVLVLIFMLVGSLVIAPLLGYMATGVKTGLVFQSKTDELYAADSGIEDGTWMIKYGNLDTLTSPAPYQAYDYADNWSDPLFNLPTQQEVNGKNVAVTIANVWVPKDTLPPDAKTQQGQAAVAAGKLIVTDSISGTSTCQIKIIYYPDSSDPELTVSTLGVWLPPGFSYVAGSSNLFNQTKAMYSSENISSYDGGQAVVWTFSPAYPFKKDSSSHFPGVITSGNNQFYASTVTFQFTSQQQSNPTAISWITTNLDVTDGGTSPYYTAWDADTKLFNIHSVAGNTQLDVYLAKNELRQLGAALNGDYRAIGNSLMVMGRSQSQIRMAYAIRLCRIAVLGERHSLRRERSRGVPLLVGVSEELQ